MGPGFWPVTAALTLVNVVVTILFLNWNIDRSITEAAEPAGAIDGLFKFLFIFGSALFVYIAGYVTYFSIVWRRRATDGPHAIGIQVHDAPKLEVLWTVIPTLIIVVLGAYSIAIWNQLQTSKGGALVMEAIGHQFNFEFRYPTLPNSVVGDMHVPVNTPVTLQITSGDVLHSFWIPEARLKADMVPGLVNTLRFTPTKTGRYRIICTEFCGIAHSKMQASLFIDTPEQFKKWIADQKQPGGNQQGNLTPTTVAAGSPDDGKKLFTQKCTTCHQMGPYEAKVVGPGLAKLTDDAAHPKLVNGKAPTSANIALILKNGYVGPIGVMPNQQANGLSGKDIADLTAYLVSNK